MKNRLKDIDQQVIVITGASSGIGLATAKMAAKQGAKVVLAARSEEGLQRSLEQIREAGGQASYVVADVSKEADVRKIAETAIRDFGRFDTWINNAGVSIYGTFDQISIEDGHQLFEINFWGCVLGSKVAAEHLRDRGGAIINVGSVESERAFPLQSMYSASKHAVKAFTDSMRMEIEEKGWPISVSLVKPSGIDTPLFENAKNYMEREPKPADPTYTPDQAATVILHCATHPMREIYVGGAGKLMGAMGRTAPRMTDLIMERNFFENQKTDQPSPKHPSHNLNRPGGRGRERGHHKGWVKGYSMYNQMQMHPVLTNLGMLAAGLAVAGIATALLGGNSLSNMLSGKSSRPSRRPRMYRGEPGGETLSDFASSVQTSNPGPEVVRPQGGDAAWGMESEHGAMSQDGSTPPASEAPESGEGSQPPPQRL
jgi:short-subunit dehydrogenase